MNPEGRRKKVLIVGGGASGLMAAISAAKAGASVTVLEHNDKPGRKLNATGNGRCNLTNLASLPDAYRGTHPEFAGPAFQQFSVQDTMNFFSETGASPVNKNGYIYPRSFQASSVTDLLLLKAKSLGVKIKTNEHVCSLSMQADAEHSWLVKTQGWQYETDAVILAAGSKASAIQGADGSGYELAKLLGHRVIPPFPALCALRLNGDAKLFSTWAGVRTEGTVKLRIEEQSYFASGELQLTEYGLSGIPVFQISRYAVNALQDRKKVTLSVDFLPEIPEFDMGNFLKERMEHAPYQNVKRGEQLLGLFPEKLIKVLIRQEDLVHAIKQLTFSVKSGMGFKQAQVCGGGVDTAEVCAETMESLLYRGLYFAGELLDIDGTCGGYNLQWAWSSGYVAGKHAAEELQKKL